MGEIVTTVTRKVTRAQIAEAVGNNPRLIRLLETLVQDVTTSIPTAIVDSDTAAQFSLRPADGSKSTAQAAARMAQDVETHVLSVLSSQRSTLHQLQAQIDDLQAQIANQRSLASRIDMLRTEVDELRTFILTRRDPSAAINQLRADLDDVRAQILGA